MAVDVPDDGSVSDLLAAWAAAYDRRFPSGSGGVAHVFDLVVKSAAGRELKPRSSVSRLLEVKRAATRPRPHARGGSLTLRLVGIRCSQETEVVVEASPRPQRERSSAAAVAAAAPTTMSAASDAVSSAAVSPVLVMLHAQVGVCVAYCSYLCVCVCVCVCARVVSAGLSVWLWVWVWAWTCVPPCSCLLRRACDCECSGGSDNRTPLSLLLRRPSMLLRRACGPTP